MYLRFSALQILFMSGCRAYGIWRVPVHSRSAKHPIEAKLRQYSSPVATSTDAVVFHRGSSLPAVDVACVVSMS